VCGTDLGDADDPYRDPACPVCLDGENEDDSKYADEHSDDRPDEAAFNEAWENGRI